MQEYTHWTVLSLLTKTNPNPITFLKFVELIGKLCLRILFLILNDKEQVLKHKSRQEQQPPGKARVSNAVIVISALTVGRHD